MPEIIDVILHSTRTYGITQAMVVIDEATCFRYQKDGLKLIAEYDGFFDAYGYERDKFAKAFAGREFDIPMADGSTILATGEYWSTVHPRHKELVSVGVGTLASLERCYVFSAGEVLKTKLDEWLSKNQPSTNYYKYSKGHPKEGQQDA